MDLRIRAPVLLAGIGGAGSRMAASMSEASGIDHVSIGRGDLGGRQARIGTGGVVNPSVRLLRAAAYEASGEIEEMMEGYGTVVMVANLAGKDGAAIAPVVSGICSATGRGPVSIAVMPFGYEGARLFEAGIALRRLREGSDATIVIDNDSMMQSNPDLAPEQCYEIADSAARHLACSLGSLAEGGTGILAAGRAGRDAEESLRDALRTLYGSAPPGSVRRSLLYVMGGGLSAGAIGRITEAAGGMLGGGGLHVDPAASESGVVVLSAVQGATKFDGYDPLGAIGQELDWDAPECSIDCGLQMYQME
ncbi:MAG: cell division protein FtsZ [Nitrosopumilus sp.]|nr:cell division protein FtsZ [Nitrosopumilus sp.]MDA7957768.1 cell division protein FtsZ [Nitrosopumilus sp.]